MKKTNETDAADAPVMGCEPVGNTIICSRGGRAKCQECGIREGTLLCDGPLPAGIVHRRSSVPGADKTCSKRICPTCATSTPTGDYCKDHATPESRRLAL
jgi:hypothetical protein